MKWKTVFSIVVLIISVMLMASCELSRPEGSRSLLTIEYESTEMQPAEFASEEVVEKIRAARTAFYNEAGIDEEWFREPRGVSLKIVHVGPNRERGHQVYNELKKAQTSKKELLWLKEKVSPMFSDSYLPGKEFTMIYLLETQQTVGLSDLPDLKGTGPIITIDKKE